MDPTGIQKLVIGSCGLYDDCTRFGYIFGLKVFRFMELSALSLFYGVEGLGVRANFVDAVRSAIPRPRTPHQLLITLRTT